LKNHSDFFYCCTAYYGGSEDAVDHPEVEDEEARAARRNTVAGPQTSVELVEVDVLAVCVYDLRMNKKRGECKSQQRSAMGKNTTKQKITANAEPGSHSGLVPRFPTAPSHKVSTGTHGENQKQQTK